MSKILAAEYKRRSEASAARAAEDAHAGGADPEIDAAAAVHLEMLSRTDAKLDQFNARLERVAAEMREMGQWGQAAHPLERQAASLVRPRPSRWPVVRFLVVCGLLGAGIMNAPALRQWADTHLPWTPADLPPPVADLPQPPQPHSAAAPSSPGRERVDFIMRQPAPLTSRVTVPPPAALVAPVPVRTAAPEPPPPVVPSIPEPAPVLPPAPPPALPPRRAPRGVMLPAPTLRQTPSTPVMLMIEDPQQEEPDVSLPTDDEPSSTVVQPVNGRIRF